VKSILFTQIAYKEIEIIFIFFLCALSGLWKRKIGKGFCHALLNGRVGMHRKPRRIFSGEFVLLSAAKDLLAMSTEARAAIA